MTPTWVTSSLHAQGYALRASEEQVLRWTMTSVQQRYRYVNQAGFVISARRVLTSATTEKLQRCLPKTTPMGSQPAESRTSRKPNHTWPEISHARHHQHRPTTSTCMYGVSLRYRDMLAAGWCAPRCLRTAPSRMHDVHKLAIADRGMSRTLPCVGRGAQAIMRDYAPVRTGSCSPYPQGLLDNNIILGLAPKST